MKYPISRKEDVKEILFGHEVADPYRWMENEGDPELNQWIDAQIATTRAYLDENGERDAILNRMKQLIDFKRYGMTVFPAGKRSIYAMIEGSQNQPKYYIHTEGECEEKTLLDPNTFSSNGTVSVFLSGLSKNKRYIGYLKSQSGSDWHTVHVLDLETGKELPDVLTDVKFTGTAWKGDGFYYSRYDSAAEGKELTSLNEFQRIYYHKLGQPQSEDQMIYEDLSDPRRYNSITVTNDEQHLILVIGAGTSGTEIRHKRADSSCGFKTIFPGFQYDYDFIGSEGNLLYFVTNDECSNYRLVAYDVEKDEMKDVVPEQENTISMATKIGNRIAIVYSKHARNHIKLFDLEGHFVANVELPGIGSIFNINADEENRRVFFSYGGFLSPVSLLYADIDTGKTTVFKEQQLPFDVSQFETEQVFFSSKDGTKVPMFITKKKGLPMDGSNPTLLYGYGGFNVSLTPTFSASTIEMLERGYIYAEVNLRGGEEYGENWHKAGMLENKQNVFDDCIAAAEYLIANKYTSPSRLALHGRSNGGLLVGAVINQRPDLFAVAFPQVGVMDMLRFHKFTIGWGWIVEYGNPDVEKDFRNIYKYSPLHNIKEMLYPATMVMTADHDDRVVPAHSFKYGATLQEKADPSRPVLIWIAKEAGHGMGTSALKVLEEKADMAVFMLKNFK